MALCDWLKSGPVATATIATSATNQIKNHRTVASVAKITVATAKKKERDDRWTTNLPEACPLLGGPVPDNCRFEPKFFMRMIHEGALVVGKTCPVLSVCKLIKDKKQKTGRR